MLKNDFNNYAESDFQIIIDRDLIYRFNNTDSNGKSGNSIKLDWVN